MVRQNFHSDIELSATVVVIGTGFGSPIWRVDIYSILEEESERGESLVSVKQRVLSGLRTGKIHVGQDNAVDSKKFGSKI
ncbi:hypothetical protein NPIL_600981 [Nephila pilipes]|uniref:Uncharacterized protein n=1 Tax=Nephila pilipes TaxID=299642 RepID=A0A8X6Q731_NEPPI|nr:hypothetical protein NPIL_600981 [Nephila pilipes]